MEKAAVVRLTHAEAQQLEMAVELAA